MKKPLLRILPFVLVGFAAFQGCSTNHSRNHQKQGGPEPLAFSQVRFEGELAARYQAATCNLLLRTDRYSKEMD
jgi:hypothetical protein